MFDEEDLWRIILIVLILKQTHVLLFYCCSRLFWEYHPKYWGKAWEAKPGHSLLHSLLFGLEMFSIISYYFQFFEIAWDLGFCFVFYRVESNANRLCTLKLWLREGGDLWVTEVRNSSTQRGYLGILLLQVVGWPLSILLETVVVSVIL